MDAFSATLFDLFNTLDFVFNTFGLNRKCKDYVYVKWDY